MKGGRHDFLTGVLWGLGLYICLILGMWLAGVLH